MKHFAFIVSAFFVFACSQKKQAVAPDVSKKAAIQYDFAYEFYVKGDLIRALASALQSTELVPTNPHAFNLLGLIYFRQEKYDKGEKAFLKAIELDPKVTEAHNNLGSMYLEQNRFIEAEKSFLEATKNPLYLYPERIYNNLGLTYHRMGNLELAKRHFESAIRQRKDFYLAYQNLGLLYLDMEKNERASSLFKKAASLCKDCSAPRYHMGTILLKENKTSDALKWFREGSKIDPEGYYGLLCKEFLLEESKTE